MKIALINSTPQLSLLFDRLKVDVDAGIEFVDELSEEDEPVDIICYYHHTQALSFENFLQNLPICYQQVPLLLILEKPDYKILMIALEKPFLAVIEAPVNYVELKKTIYKLQMQASIVLSKSASEKHHGDLLALYSSPDKFISNREFFFSLKKYFKAFKGFESLGIFEKCLDRIKLIHHTHYDSVNSVESDLIYDVTDALRPGAVMEAKAEDVFYFIFKVDQKDDMHTLGVVAYKQETNALNQHFLKLLESVSWHRRQDEQLHTLHDLSITDEITGLYNQRKLASDLEAAIENYYKTQQSFCLMFIDVDHFKVVNDNFGHVVGSQMLIEMGNTFSKYLNARDSIYRYGGDEFVILVPDKKISEVKKIAEIMCEEVKKLRFQITHEKVHQLSVSIGIGEFPRDGNSAVAILSFADEMMYESKKAGRGTVRYVVPFTT
jgi:diguanylate cyclase (GGDEF)-like protein